MLTSIPFGVTTWLVGCITFLLVWAKIRRPKGLPPGPLLSLPLMGYLPFIKGTILDTYSELRKKYGDIFHIYMGPQMFIVLNGYDVIKEALVHHGDLFTDRPSLHMYSELGLNKGLITSSGAIWKEQRTFALQALREFGFGKNVLQEKIKEELMYFLGTIEETKGKAFDIKYLVHTAVSNITSNIVFGKRFTYGDPEFHRYIHILDEILGSGPEAIFQGTFLRNLPGDVTGYKANVNRHKEIRETFIEVFIREHLEHFEPNTIGDFIDAYIKEMKDKEKRGAETSISAENLWRTILDLFIAGTETMGSSIRWALIYILNYPHIQDRLHHELQDKVGSGRLPSLEDRSELPFLNAFILETLRVANIAPLAVPHTASVEFILRGYRIPKDSFIHINLESVLKDPALWEDPYTFNPDRFIKEGKMTKPEEFIAFGLGRRVCLGEALARMQLFLFLASMLQRFRFEPAENQPLPSMKGILGSNHIPHPFQIKAIMHK